MCHRFELLYKQPLAIKINQARSQPVFTFHPSCHTITFSIFQLLFTGRTASGFKYPILTSLHSNLLELEDLFHIWYSHNYHPVSYVTVTIYYHILFKDSTLKIHLSKLRHKPVQIIEFRTVFSFFPEQIISHIAIVHQENDTFFQTKIIITGSNQPRGAALI